MNRKLLGWLMAGVIAVAVSAIRWRMEKVPAPGESTGAPTTKVPDHLVKAVAPHARRTPATDPNVTTTGPRLGPWQTLPPERGLPVGPAPGAGRFFFVTVGPPQGGERVSTRLVSVALDGSGPERQVLSLPGEAMIDRVRCAGGTRLPCAVQVRYDARYDARYDVRYDEERDAGGADDRHPDVRYQNFVVDVDGSGETRSSPARPLRGPASERAGLAGDAPVAPDGSFIALGDWRLPKRSDERARQSLLFYTRAGVAAARVELDKVPIEVVGWRGEGRALRAVVRAGWLVDKDPPADQLEIDPRGGGRRALEGLPEEEAQISPDGRYRAFCREERELVIVERATGHARTFLVPADDWLQLEVRCPRWVSARYLAYQGASLAGVLDAETLKANDALGANSEQVAFTNDFRFAVNRDGARALVAKILDGGADAR